MKERRCRWNIAFSCFSEGLVAGRGYIESLKFGDSSGLALLGVVTIEVHVRFGCLYQYFHFCSFLGVSIHALDRIAFTLYYYYNHYCVGCLCARYL